MTYIYNNTEKTAIMNVSQHSLMITLEVYVTQSHG